jgi:tRNA1Val (adenine37-N6)-methyltransferase
MQQLRLEPKMLRCVHPRSGERANLVLVEGCKGGGAGLLVEPPLYVYEGTAYSAEILAMYALGN